MFKLSAEGVKKAKMSIEEAIDKAREFLQRRGGYYNLLLQKVAYDETTGKWYVEFDIGIFKPLILKVTINDATGSIIDYERRTT